MHHHVSGINLLLLFANLLIISLSITLITSHLKHTPVRHLLHHRFHLLSLTLLFYTPDACKHNVSFLMFPRPLRSFANNIKLGLRLGIRY